MEGLISPGSRLNIIVTAHNALQSHSQAKFKHTGCAESSCIIVPDVKTCSHHYRVPHYLPLSHLVT